MNLYLVRHGIAEDAAPEGDDRSRALTAAGTEKVRLGARALDHAGIGIDVLVSSPLTRAVQTAEVLGEQLGVAVEQDHLLGPGCHLPQLHELLRRQVGAQNVMIVGHQPDFGWLVHELTGANVKFRKGAIAVVRLEQAEAPVGQLRGLYDPDVLAVLGR